MKRPDSTVDPRIAATGGRRRTFGDDKSNYEWPGMASKADWAKTSVHKHTGTYACAWCGLTLTSPHAVYTHLDKRHPRAGRRAA